MGKLTYQQIHNKNFYKHRDKLLSARPGRTEFYTLKTSKANYKELNDLEIPSSTLIQQHQSQYIKLMGQKNNAALRQYVDKINLDFRSLIIGTYQDLGGVDLSNFLKMEEIFGTWLSDIDLQEGNKNGVIKESLSNIKKELRENQLMIGNYKILRASMLALFEDLKKEEINDKELLRKIKSMEQTIASMDSALRIEDANIKDSQFINPSALQTINAKGGKTTYLNQLIGLGYQVKGRYLELKVMEFLFEKLSQVSDILVVDTANSKTIHVSVLGEGHTQTGARKSETDILLVLKETLDKIDNVKGNQVYTIDNESYEEIKQKAIGGIQVKSGINQSPFNNFDVTWRQLYSLNEGDGYAKYSLMLNSLMQEHRAKYYMYTTDRSMSEPLYNPIFNYLLAKGVSRIVGEKNTLFASREGIQFMDEYLEDKLSQGYLIKAKDYVNILSYDKNYSVNLKNNTI